MKQAWMMVVVLALACAGGLAQQVTECTIIGQVYGPRGEFPVKHILVSLETRGATITSVFTDDEGRFLFSHLEGNLYHVSVNDDDYLPATQSTALTPQTNPTAMLRIDLVPKNASNEKTAQPGRLAPNAHTNEADSQGRATKGENPYLVDSTAFSKQVPSKARREFDAGVKADARKKLDEAIEHYHKALKIAPDYGPAHNNLGTDYLARGDLPQAEKEFREVVSRKTNDAAGYFNLGNVLLLTRRWDDAERQLKAGLTLEPNSAFGEFLLGTVAAKRGDAVQAERSLLRALELDPQLFKAHLALANLYVAQHRDHDAAQQLVSFLKDAPNDPLAPKATALLQKINK